MRRVNLPSTSMISKNSLKINIVEDFYIKMDEILLTKLETAILQTSHWTSLLTGCGAEACSKFLINPVIMGLC